MSPYRFSSSHASVFLVNNNGYLRNGDVINAYGVRPAINIRADVQITGSGTSTDPFTVVGA